MDEVSLIDYLVILKKRKRTVLMWTIIVLVVVGAILVVMPRTYEGEAVLIFPQQQEASIGMQLAQATGLSFLGGSLPMVSGRDVYVSVLKSRSLSTTVCSRLRLDRYDVDWKDLQDAMGLETPKEGSLVFTFQVPTSWLKGYVAGSELADQTARLAARIVNTYIAELRAYDQSNTLFLGRKNRRFVDDQLRRTRAELAAAEVRLKDFQERNPVLAIPDKASVYTDQMLLLLQRQTEADVELRGTEGELARTRATWNARAPRDITPEAVIDSPVITELRAQLARLEVQRASLLEDLTEEHPDVVSLAQQIEKTYDKIKAEVASVAEGKTSSASPAHQELLKQLVVLEITRDGLQSRCQALADTIRKSEQQLSDLPAREMEYARLIRDLKASEMVYSALLAESAKARITEGRDAENFLVLDDAVAPEKPEKPRVVLTLAVGLIMGLMLGTMLATLQSPKLGKRA